MAPSESGASRRELFGHGAIVFLAVQPAVFADRKAEHQVGSKRGQVPLPERPAGCFAQRYLTPF